jgi:SAM-dependent methyltransferase
MNTREQWIEVMRNVHTGHAPEAASSVDASLREAKSFVEFGVAFRGARILDLGSGNGRQAVGLSYCDLAEYVGIEPVQVCVEFSQAAFAAFPNFRFVWVDLCNGTYNPQGAIDPATFRIPADDGHFDSVLAGSLFTHLENEDVCMHYLAETARVLKPGGCLYSTWFRAPPNQICASAHRTVFTESAVITMLTRHFTFYHTSEGMTDGYHDQWRTFTRKASDVR